MVSLTIRLEETLYNSIRDEAHSKHVSINKLIQTRLASKPIAQPQENQARPSQPQKATPQNDPQQPQQKKAVTLPFLNKKKSIFFE